MTEEHIEKELDKLLIDRGEHYTRVRNPIYGEERDLAKRLAKIVLNEDKIYYDALSDCCNSLLNEVDKGNTPRRQIMGLKMLLNR